MGKKQIFNATLTAIRALSERYSMLTLSLPATVGDMEVLPGQFVEIRVADSPSTYLRRPISICDYDAASRVMTLLIRRAGEGTEHLCDLPEGSADSVRNPAGQGIRRHRRGGHLNR